MELEIINTVWIDTETIINSILDNSFDNVDDAIDDYISGLDDCDYYMIGITEHQKIKEEIMKDPFVQKKLA